MSNSIQVREYARSVACRTFVIGSTADKTLSAELQKQVQACFDDGQIKLFDHVGHKGYLVDEQVNVYIRTILE